MRKKIQSELNTKDGKKYKIRTFLNNIIYNKYT